MATQDVTTLHEHSSRSGFGILRSALTGAVVLTVLFLVCWAPAAAGLFAGSHAYVSLFTAAPVGSAVALAMGVVWSLICGAFIGALIAITYDAFKFIGRG